MRIRHFSPMVRIFIALAVLTSAHAQNGETHLLKVAILPFENRTPNPNIDWVSSLFVDSYKSALGKRYRFENASETDTAKALEIIAEYRLSGKTRYQVFAAVTGAEVVLGGSFSPSGSDSILIESQLYAARHPEREHGLVAYSCLAPQLMKLPIPAWSIAPFHWLIFGRLPWPRARAAPAAPRARPSSPPRTAPPRRDRDPWWRPRQSAAGARRSRRRAAAAGCPERSSAWPSGRRGRGGTASSSCAPVARTSRPARWRPRSAGTPRRPRRRRRWCHATRRSARRETAATRRARGPNARPPPARAPAQPATSERSRRGPPQGAMTNGRCAPRPNRVAAAPIPPVAAHARRSRQRRTAPRSPSR